MAVLQYYAAGSRGRAAGLRFPGDDSPGYGEFFYLATLLALLIDIGASML